MLRNPRSSRYFSWLPLIGAVVLSIGILLGLRLQNPNLSLFTLASQNKTSNTEFGGSTIDEVIRFVEAKYVDKLDRGTLIKESIDNLLISLDPHTVYMTSDEVNKYKQSLKGEALSFGFKVDKIADTITVTQIINSSINLQRYDKILSVNGKNFLDPQLSIQEAREFINNSTHKSIKINIQRRGGNNPIELKLSKQLIARQAVSKGYMLSDQTGYIAIHSFNDSTYQRFMTQLDSLSLKCHAKNLILDLRGNSGGYLDQAIQITSQFFNDQGVLLAYTQGANSPKKEHKSTGRVYFPLNEIFILIDQNTASASEVIAGALQDWDRGVIIGSRSFGKGLVQELFPLKDGSAVNITVSRNFTPSGRSIQRSYDDVEDYLTVDDSALDTSIQFVSSNGRELLGGGGIVPDIRVEEPLLEERPELKKIFQQFSQKIYWDLKNGNTPQVNSEVLKYFNLSKMSLEEKDKSKLINHLLNQIEIEKALMNGEHTKALKLKLNNDDAIQIALEKVGKSSEILSL